MHSVYIECTLYANTNGDIHAKPPGPVQGDLTYLIGVGCQGGGKAQA